jgi:hypothetical protein
MRLANQRRTHRSSAQLDCRPRWAGAWTAPSLEFGIGGSHATSRCNCDRRWRGSRPRCDTLPSVRPRRSPCSRRAFIVRLRVSILNSPPRSRLATAGFFDKALSPRRHHCDRDDGQIPRGPCRRGFRFRATPAGGQLDNRRPPVGGGILRERALSEWAETSP